MDAVIDAVESNVSAVRYEFLYSFLLTIE